MRYNGKFFIYVSERNFVLSMYLNVLLTDNLLPFPCEEFRANPRYIHQWKR